MCTLYLYKNTVYRNTFVSYFYMCQNFNLVSKVLAYQAMVKRKVFKSWWALKRITPWTTSSSTNDISNTKKSRSYCFLFKLQKKQASHQSVVEFVNCWLFRCKELKLNWALPRIIHTAKIISFRGSFFIVWPTEKSVKFYILFHTESVCFVCQLLFLTT